ncbi:MAG: hypothetical protein AAFX78_18890 [Cyanobacteria bacterium J06638_20]
MRKKENMILEYNPKEGTRHIYYAWEKKPPYSPDWVNLGVFHGTELQASRELTTRIKAYQQKLS